MKKTAIIFSFVLALLAFGQRAWAQNYITDVMVIGHNDMTEFNNLYNSYTAQGWTGISYNLNDGINNAHCINLMFKSSESPSAGVDITDFYLRVSDSNDAPEALVHQTHIYFRADCDGSDLFKSSNGDLNCGAGGKYIHLYYTRFLSLPAVWSVVGISFDNSSTYSVAENDGSSPCNLNKGAGGSDIYMHVSKSMTGGRVVVHNEAELKDALLLDNAQIQFGNDIATSSLLEINNSRTVTIDMNGFTLDRGCTSRGSQVIVIRTGSTLNLSNGTLTRGWGGNGGALDIENGTIVNLTDVIITGNTADDRGGAIANSGTLTMTNCTLSGNTSRDNVENIGGGGLINYANCTATLTNVTIDGNNALYGGGLCNRGTLNMEGCTISNNLAYLFGGGIRNEGTLTMTDCTVADNECSNESILAAYDGGGIYNHGTLNINGCNISGNTCKANGSGIWNDATLNIQGNVQIKGNNDDDIYLPTGSKITVTGALTGGPSSIGVRMQSAGSGLFTHGYTAHNSQTDHFFSNVIPNDIVLKNGEAKMRYGYYECSWDSDNRQLVHTVKHVPDDVWIENICSSVTDGATLMGYNIWYIAEGTGSADRGHELLSDVHLILCDDAQYTINQGLFVNEGTTLHIYSQSYGDRMGKLICNGGDSQPGIGPRHGGPYAGNIDIHGGDIKATGGDQAAGIGGCEDRSSGTITIWDGNIEATGGDYGAGIGGGDGGDGTYFYIYGGTIKATSGQQAAGIGGGNNFNAGGESGRIEIFGGTVDALAVHGGNGGGAGIGSGDDGHRTAPIIIWDGVVTARSLGRGAAIGGGRKTHGGSITIHGGFVTAIGWTYAAAIGGGECDSEGALDPWDGGDSGEITINGGFVTAIARSDNDDPCIAEGAAIGGGGKGSVNHITINDGIVIANSEDGAAIGCGLADNNHGGKGGNITINGGSVVALAMTGGAGIGGGRSSHPDDPEGGHILITGGEVMAIGGAHKFVHKTDSSPFSAGNLIQRICTFLLNLKAGSLAGPAINGMLVAGANAIGQAINLAFQEDEWGGAGIGGGKGDICPWNVDIQGGYVVAHGGHSGSQAIGHGFDSEVTGSLSLYDNATVSAGSKEDNHSAVLAANRVSACRNNLFAVIKPCGHKGADSYTDNGDGTYTINEESCQYCGIEGEQTCHHTFTDDGAWNDANNWNSGHVPNDGNDVVICAHCEIPADYVAKADTVSIPYYDSIFIKDGGQLFHSNAGVTATVEKNITGHGGDNDNGWYFIASPMTEDITPTNENGFLTNEHDLYYYHEPTCRWRNYKLHEGNADPGFLIEPQKGYLYANEATTTLSFMGTLQAGTQSGSNYIYTVDSLSYACNNENLRGWNLVGNPFPCNAVIDKSCYTIEGDAINPEAHEANSYVIPPCTSVMVKADGTNQSVTFTKTTEQASQGRDLQITLTQVPEPVEGPACKGNGVSTSSTTLAFDNAIVSFTEGNELEKFVFNADNAKFYIPQNGKDLAIAFSETQGEMPVNFKATENGKYTITVHPVGVEMNYLHLIDNMTGENIDLLFQPSYTFEACTTDYESRFRLVFASVGENTDGDNETFAFYSNGNWVIANEGEATLQVIDVTGRVLSSESINGYCTKAIDAAPGVYILKLNDKVQKIVIR